RPSTYANRDSRECRTNGAQDGPPEAPGPPRLLADHAARTTSRSRLASQTEGPSSNADGRYPKLATGGWRSAPTNHRIRAARHSRQESQVARSRRLGAYESSPCLRQERPLRMHTRYKAPTIRNAVLRSNGSLASTRRDESPKARRCAGAGRRREYRRASVA